MFFINLEMAESLLVCTDVVSVAPKDPTKNIQKSMKFDNINCMHINIENLKDLKKLEKLERPIK